MPLGSSRSLADIRKLHQQWCIADGHADSLMWNRDLNVLSEEGQVDFPRLREAGVKLQCFTLVTRGFPFIGGFPAFAAWRGWPKESRQGPWARAQWQIERLNAFCASSGERARVVHTAADLAQNLEAKRLSAVLGIEGAHVLEGQVERVQVLHRQGVRFMGLTHLSNNELAGSSFPLMGNRGLSTLGKEVLGEMARLNISLDVAHASERTLDEVFSHSGIRPFCSHTGARGVSGGARNLSDDHLRAIAKRRGVAGMIFATVYLGGNELSDVVRHIEHALEVMGEEGVGLGSDFDGMVALPRGVRDVRDLPKLTEQLLQRHPEERVQRVLGENFRRFFAETLSP